MGDFLYSGTIPLDDSTTIKENLTTVFGFQEDMTFIDKSRTFINNSRHEIDQELIARTKIKQEAVENMDENFEGAMDFLASTEFNEGLDEVLSEASRSSKPLEIPQESEIQETIRKEPLENVTLVKLKPIEEITERPTSGGNQLTSGGNQPTSGGNQPTSGGNQPIEYRDTVQNI